MTTRRFFTNIDGGTTLAGNINSAVTSINVANAGSFPSSTPFTAVIEHGTANAEAVLVTVVASNTLTVTRGYDGTTAVNHGTGVAIRSEVVALDLNEASAHTSASTAVHGIAGAVVGTTDSQTLTNKTLTSPTVSNPTVTGTLTAATISASGAISTSSTAAVTGNATVGGTLAVTGAATAASFTANGNGQVGGVIVPKSYTNQAGAGTATAGLLVWLTAPTGGWAAGLFQGNGTIWVPLTVGQTAKATSTSALSLTNATNTVVPWTSNSIVGPSGLYTYSAANGFTVLLAGTYLVSGVISYAANGTGRRGAYVTVNGTPDTYAQLLVATATPNAPRIPAPTSVLSLNANDVVTLMAFQDAGGALALGGAHELNIVRLS